jgi:hypothetical protein
MFFQSFRQFHDQRISACVASVQEALRCVASLDMVPRRAFRLPDELRAACHRPLAIFRESVTMSRLSGWYASFLRSLVVEHDQCLGPSPDG